MSLNKTAESLPNLDHTDRVRVSESICLILREMFTQTCLFRVTLSSPNEVWILSFTS